MTACGDVPSRPSNTLVAPLAWNQPTGTAAAPAGVTLLATGTVSAATTSDADNTATGFGIVTVCGLAAARPSHSCAILSQRTPISRFRDRVVPPRTVGLGAVDQIRHKSDRGIRPQQFAAVRATTLLVVGARAEGWMVTELAGALGLKVATLRKRLESIEAAPPTGGLAITPPAPTMPAPPLPVEQREWLATAEAAAAAVVTSEAIAQWYRAGLLPNTQRRGKVQLRYARSDLERVLAAPRHGRRGVSWAAVRVEIAQLP